MPLRTMEVMVCNMEIPETPRYQYAREKAIDILVDYGTNSLPISVKKISNNLPFKILFNTYSHLMKQHGFSYAEVCGAYKSEDGAVIQNGDEYCILYNDIDRSSQRIRFTLAHELGHIILGHLQFDACLYRLSDCQYDVLEKEANQFASQLLSPEPLIYDILKKSHSINTSQIRNIFDISYQSADCVLKRMNSRGGIFCYRTETLHDLYAEPLNEIYQMYI